MKLITNPTKWERFYLGMAEYVAKASKDPSTKVGAVIVRPDNTVASVGYNGFPKTMFDNEQWLQNREEKYSRIVHGEMNALIHAREPVAGYSLYTFPFMPCDRCVVHMAQAGIVKIVAPDATEDQKTRWATAFEKTKLYCLQCNIDLLVVTSEPK